MLYMDNVNHILPWIAEITKCLGEKSYHMYRLSKTMAPTKRIPPTLTPETKATGSSWKAVVATPVGKFLISNK